MRKIYSLVLMAAALLVGTNAWADVHDTQDPSDEAKVTKDNGDTWKYATTLKEAFDYVAMNETAEIVLLKEPLPLNVSITMPASISATDLSTYTGQNIKLDLNGNNISATGKSLFRLVKGKLNITGRGTLSLSGNFTYPWVNAAVIVVGGHSDPSITNWSNLTIGKDVFLSRAQGNGEEIGILIQDHNGLESLSNDDVLFATGYNSGNGSKVVEKYGYCTWYSGSDPSKTNLACGASDNDQRGSAFGVNVTVAGTISAHKYGMKIQGHVNQVPTCSPSGNFPNITIESTATVSSSADAGCCGIYSSGYGVWNIKGTVYGATGIYMKAGEVSLVNADVSSTYPSSTLSDGKNSGVGGAGGSAISIESNVSYGGESGLTISGDTKVEGGGGYAIYEQTYLTTDTDEDGNPDATTSHVTIEGGTIEGGTQGSIAVATSTADVTTIEGGNVGGTDIALTGANGETTGATITVTSVVPQDENHHTTVVTDPVTNKTTVVVSEGAVPSPATYWSEVAALSDQENPKNVKWTDNTTPGNINSGTIYLGELQMISGDNTNKQELNIKSGATLNVQHLIMNNYARITVEAGGKLIVEGTQGIVAPKVENITLQATASKQAMLLFNPAVSSNRQPNATVQLYTYCHQPSASTYKWQRFTTPVRTTLSVAAGTISNDYNESTHGSLVSGSTFTSWVNYWDEMTQTWKGITSWANIKPFEDFMICNNTSAGGVTYTFKGELQGSVSSDLNFEANGWNYFGNSYTAPISVLSMIQQVASSAGSAVDGTVYVWDLDNQIYEAVNSLSFDLAALPDAKPVAHPDVPAMTVFVMKLRTGNDAVANLGYGPSVYEYNNPTNPAPARAMQQNIGVVRLSVVDENGVKDEVALVEGDAFTADFENGADAEKMITEDRINFYAGVEMPYAINASDKLEGMVLSLKTADAIDYTLTVDNVVGVDYAIKDNITGQVILLQEGNVYHFNAQPNATLDGRFQIVSRQEMPTAVETVEETVNAPKAIYTIMGQYVGETTDWNNLPAGVYVVDGVKVIK